MHDTLKKPRELLAVSYAVRFPDLAAKSKHPGGEVDLDTMDPQVCVSMIAMPHHGTDPGCRWLNATDSDF